ISPSILVSELEIEKRQKGSDRPPLLPAPTDASPGARVGQAARLSVTAAKQVNTIPVATAKQADSAPQSRPAIPENDVLLRAMADEMQRTHALLKMDTFAPPYFVAYTTQENENMSVSAAMGALIASDTDRSRRLWSDVRVGDANLDNTNFLGRGGGGFGGFGEGSGSADSLPLEDEYDAVRRAVWLATDDAYKNAIETLSSKRAALQNQAEEQRPPGLGKAEPYSLTTDTPALDADRAAWENTARAVSATFRRFPGIEDGRLVVSGQRQTQRFLNSEGSWHRTGTILWTAMVQATARTADNNLVSDS